MLNWALGRLVGSPAVRLVGLLVLLIALLAGPLVQLGARVRAPQSYEGQTTIRGQVPVANVHELQATLPGLTGGEGLVETELAGFEPVLGEPPVRTRRGATRRDGRSS